MKRTTRVKWGELRVGLLITIAIAALLWASFSGGGTSIFSPKIGFKGYFTNVNGLVTGAPVWIAGVEVGNVESIKFVNLDSVRQIEISFRIMKSVSNMLTTDAAIKLGTIGFLGDKYIEVVPGTLSNPRLEPGSVVRTIPSADLNQMIMEGENTMHSTRKLTENLSDLTTRMKAGEGSMGQLFTNDTLFHELTVLVSAMTTLVKELQKNQERLTSSVETASRSLENITSQINSKTGTAGKFISDPALYDNLRSSAGRLDSILARIDRGEGTAGALVRDDSLYINLRNLIARVDNLVTDIERNPRKYFKFSVF